MKKRELILHCSDSQYIQHGVDEIRKWHTDPKKILNGKNIGGRGWSDIGYHYVGEKHGNYKGVEYGGVKVGRPYSIAGAHTLGNNGKTGYCICGKSGDFQNEQMKDLENFIIDNRSIITKITQHSDYEPNKPHCAGLTDSQLKYLNKLLG